MNAVDQQLALKPSRHEDLRLVAGLGKYTADWNLPNQAYAHVIRSDRPHALIRSLDVSAVRGALGVLAVLTADDVKAAGAKTVPTGASLTDKDNQPQKIAGLPLLAEGKVRFVGQPIAMVIAESVRAAQDAAELVQIDYEDLPAVASVEQALAPGAAQLHDGIPGNLSLDFEAGDRAATDAAFKAARFTTRHRIHSQRLVGAPMELRASLVDFDPATGRYRVYTPTQGMLGMRASISGVSGVPIADIEVIAQDVGGSFGLRGGTQSEQILLMMAAKLLGRPVKWTATRSELFVGEWHGRALTLEGEVALDKDGNMLAIRFVDTIDLGAYTCYWGSFIGSKNISVTMGGVYKVPALYMSSKLAFTNTVPVSAYRGAGRPDIAFAIETLMDAAAAEHGFDRIALRRKNFIPKNAFPYKTANVTVYDCGDFEGVLNKALKLADFDGFAARQADSAKRGKLRGIGLGCYLEASGGGGAPKDQVSCRWDKDGKVSLFGVTGPSGQGHETSFAEIVARGLGVSMDDVRYRASDPKEDLIGNGTGGSRSLYGAGSAFKVLVDRVIARGLPLAAQALGVAATEVQYRDSAFRAGERSLTVSELARRVAGASPHPLDCDGDSLSGTTFPNGCHVAELEIDRKTGVTELVNYSAIDDLGNIISRQLVIGQVHGGVMQGVGQAFGEHAIYDDASGQLLTGSFMDYVMPRVGWMNRIHWDDHPVPTALNALGAKGVGESGCSGSLPAISNAMLNALRPLGVKQFDMPFTPARVWELVK